jgi:hypothetical protein
MNRVFPRERARERTRSSNFLPRRSIASSMLDYEGSSTELVGSSGAELRHNPLSFQLKTRLLRARAMFTSGNANSTHSIPRRPRFF